MKLWNLLILMTKLKYIFKIENQFKNLIDLILIITNLLFQKITNCKLNQLKMTIKNAKFNKTKDKN